MRTIVIGIVALAGCTQSGSTATNSPILTGDVCSIYTDASDCTANQQCTWLGTGCACPPDDPNCGCPPGTCASIDDGSGSGSGSATAGSGSSSTLPVCACSEAGVCVAENGQPITCIVPNPGAGDPCTLIPDLTCQDSTTIIGLCVCD
jgi:hypothetical protein